MIRSKKRIYFKIYNIKMYELIFDIFTPLNIIRNLKFNKRKFQQKIRNFFNNRNLLNEFCDVKIYTNKFLQYYRQIRPLKKN